MCGISHRYKIIFLSNHKCASSSIDRFLRKNQLIDEYFTQMQGVHMHSNKKHTFLNALLQDYPKLREYKVLVTVRNPFSRMVSLFNYGSAHVSNLDGIVPKEINEALQQISLNPMHPNNYETFRWFVIDQETKLKFTQMTVLRIEDIDSNALIKTLVSLGVPRRVIRDPVLDTVNASKQKVTVKHLNHKTRCMIANWFRFEIKAFYPDIKT